MGQSGRGPVINASGWDYTGILPRRGRKDTGPSGTRTRAGPQSAGGPVGGSKVGSAQVQELVRVVRAPDRQGVVPLGERFPRAAVEAVGPLQRFVRRPARA